MNINPDGTVGIDLAALTEELGNVKHLPLAAQKATMQRIQIEGLLDMAVSLRTLAEEATLAMQGFDGLAALDTPEPTPAELDAERDFLVEGDLVHAVGSDIIAEVISLHVDQDEVYAVVDYQGVKSKEWQKNLVRLRGDERPNPDPLAEVILPNGDGEESEEFHPEIVAEGIADDLDDDFDGDDHSEAESALAKLRALEKAPAKKKSGVKKGKKP